MLQKTEIDYYCDHDVLISSKFQLCLLCHSGTLWNTKASLPAARQAQTLNAVLATLSQCLDLDAGTLIPELKQAEEARHRNAPAVTDTEDQAAGEFAVEEMDEEAPNQKRNGKSVKADYDFSDLVPVSVLSHKVSVEVSADKSSNIILLHVYCGVQSQRQHWQASFLCKMFGSQWLTKYTSKQMVA